MNDDFDPDIDMDEWDFVAQAVLWITIVALLIPSCAATSTRTVDMDAFGRKCVLCHADHRRYQEAMGDLYACSRCHESVTDDLRTHDLRKFAFSRRYTSHD